MLASALQLPLSGWAVATICQKDAAAARKPSFAEIVVRIGQSDVSNRSLSLIER